MRQEKDAKRMAIGVPLSAIRLGRAAESKMKQDAMKGKGAAADNSSSRVKFSKSSEVFKQLVMPPPPPLLHRHYHICTSLFPAHHLVLFCRLLTHARPPPASAKRKEIRGGRGGRWRGTHARQALRHRRRQACRRLQDVVNAQSRCVFRARTPALPSHLPLAIALASARSPPTT